MELEGPDLHLILAQQFQMGYTKAYDKDLHKVPNNILHFRQFRMVLYIRHFYI